MMALEGPTSVLVTPVTSVTSPAGFRLFARCLLVCRGTARQYPVRHRVDPLSGEWRARIKRHVLALRNTAR
jgi:hypothetical protein